MANLAASVMANQHAIDQNVLAEMNSQQSIWDYFGFVREDFVAMPEHQKNALISKYYYDKLKGGGSIDGSISSKIRESEEIRLTKTRDGSKTEMQVELSGAGDKRQKQLLAWSRNGFFMGDCDNFKVVKANMPENMIFYLNQAFTTTKEGKKFHYNDIYVIGQLMPLALQAQPDDIDSYVCAHNEVKILRALYHLKTGKFQGIKQCVAAITVRGDDNAQFFDYSYDEKNDTTRLYSVQKTKIPSSFRSTCFSFLKNRIDSHSLRGEFSDVFFYLPSTIDRCEEVNKYMTMVYLRPVFLDIAILGLCLIPLKNSTESAWFLFSKRWQNRAHKISCEMQTLTWPRLSKTTALLSGQRVKKRPKKC